MTINFFLKEKNFKLELDINLSNNLMKYKFYIKNKKIFEYLFEYNLFFFTDSDYSYQEINNFVIEYKPSKYLFKFKNLEKETIKKAENILGIKIFDKFIEILKSPLNIKLENFSEYKEKYVINLILEKFFKLKYKGKKCIYNSNQKIYLKIKKLDVIEYY